MALRVPSLALIILALTLVGCATTKPAANANAAQHPTPEAAQFDFWIGAWDVRTTQGDKPAGRSVITKILGGWVIEENWTSASGSSGKSFNTYAPRTRRWRQRWVGDAGTVTDRLGQSHRRLAYILRRSFRILQGLFGDSNDFTLGHGRHVTLQHREFFDVFRRKEVWPGRQHLAEL